ncbi:MAG: sugar transferase [Lunatimonas sp.]|uniref:sugar transferase n=1 Tax=Lunatimonas sp. TaxID=2060141 RepID=UPI00263B4D76|nr:sugar transferase [Lunatimonas sp.]MCC5939703.1 sugar transferase [Lunatimonas sp.]
MEKFLQRSKNADFYYANISGFVTANGDVFFTDPFKLSLKRAMDVLVSLFLIVFVMVWLFPLIAIGIKLSSRGPVLFRQRRHGKGNMIFECYKFRTMRINKDADSRQATKEDPRVTQFGRFLRRTSLDELPQLFNVLKGEMSLIGPRPHAVPMNELFGKEVENYMFRHVVKPGITGLAQCRGFRGEVESFYDIYGRIKLDHFYIKNWCFLLDFKILYWTIFTVLFKREKAY